MRGARAGVGEGQGPGDPRAGATAPRECRCRGFWAGDLEKAVDTHAGEPVRSALGCTCHSRNPPLSPSKQKAAVHLPSTKRDVKKCQQFRISILLIFEKDTLCFLPYCASHSRAHNSCPVNLKLNEKQ